MEGLKRSTLPSKGTLAPQALPTPARKTSSDSLKRPSLSDPEFHERHSYYVKKSKHSCCSCLRSEIRLVKKNQRNQISWTAVMEYTGSASEGLNPSAKNSNTNLSEAFWLSRATNYPIPICHWSLVHHEWNEVIAEQWLHDEAAAHGYCRKDLPKHRGIVGVTKKADGCVMLELRVVSTDTKQAEAATKLACLHQALAKVSQRALQNHKSRIYIDQDDQLNPLQSQLEKEMKLDQGTRVTICRGIVYRSKAGENISTLVTSEIATVEGCQIGFLGLMIHYAAAAVVPSFDLPSLSHHIIRANPLTLGPETHGTNNTVLDELGKKHSRTRFKSNTMEYMVRVADKAHKGHRRISKIEEFNSHAGDHKELEYTLGVADKAHKGHKRISRIDECDHHADDQKELGKHYAEESRLHHQRFYSDPSITVGQYLASNNVTLIDFVKFECAGDPRASRQC